MSDTFEGFGEAARLYAENSAVVDKMYAAFEADVATFLNALRDQMKLAIRLGNLVEEPSNTYRSWWISDDRTSQEDDVPYICVRIDDSRIVVPGILTVTACADGKLKSHRERFRSELNNLRLPESCKPVRGPFGISSFAISYRDRDPLGVTTESAVEILSTLHKTMPPGK